MLLSCRDLKPENILLGADMHIQITDFGTAKMFNKDDEGEHSTSPCQDTAFLHHCVCWLIWPELNVYMLQTVTNIRLFETLFNILLLTSKCPPIAEKANSFVGTAEYVSPELLQKKVAYKR